MFSCMHLWLNHGMRWIYISPHLDDVILSAGGLIYEQTQAGTPVEIWTMICGVPPLRRLSELARDLHRQWGTTTARQTVLLRRREDRAAATRVGARVRHFDVPDCIYRLGPDGEFLYSDIFVPPHPFEADLPTRITAELASCLRSDDMLFGPLAIGGHVDHVIVRQAVEALGRPLQYFADIPYLLYHPEALEPAVKGMRVEVWPVGEAGLQAWIDGVAAYRSQIAALFVTGTGMRAGIQHAWEVAQGVRLWRWA
jgi:LmbE family N-acetylglucosaminyl deacetylase